MQDVSGITALKKINEMTKIESQYFQLHENNFEVDIPEDLVVLPGAALVNRNDEPIPAVRLDTRNAPRLGLSGGRFQIRR
jgi:hypothetical protein